MPTDDRYKPPGYDADNPGTVPNPGRNVATDTFGADVGDELDRAVDHATDQLDQVRSWVREQVDELPIATALGAFAVGWIVATGLPRALVRATVRVGLPMAAAVTIARVLARADEERAAATMPRPGDLPTPG